MEVHACKCGVAPRAAASLPAAGVRSPEGIGRPQSGASGRVASLETMASADLRLPALLARLLLGFPKPLDERRGRLTNIVLLARGVRVPLDDFIFLEEVDVVPAGVG